MSVVAVCSGKGSPGATFISVNLAAAMARAGDEVMLLDMDPAGGDLAAYLGLDPRRGLYPLLRMNDRAPGTDALLREAEDRAGVLCVSGFPEASCAASVVTLASLLGSARASDRLVIADLGRVCSETAGVARAADLVLIVVRPDLVSALGAERTLRVLRATCAPDVLRAVVSGTDRHRPADLKEVSDAIKTPVIGWVPFDRRAARRALVQQSPVARRRVVRAFEALAAAIRDRLAPPVVPVTQTVPSAEVVSA